MKRLRDVLCAVILLVLLSPLLLLIASVIKVTSAGPVTFRQERTGYCGKSFTIFKFRTMYYPSQPFSVVTVTNDPRITPVGKFLRSTHLDELPQLLNVLRGEMSLVGPRPHPLEITALALTLNPRYHSSFKVLPGMTGPAQLRGRPWILAHRQEAIILEIEYAHGRSAKSDWQILLETCLVVWKKQGI